MATVVDLGALGTQGFIAVSDSNRYSTGESVGAAGDVNGDGFDDLIIGSGSGNAYVIFGQSTGFDTINLGNLEPPDGITIDSNFPDFPGRSVASAGDVNGDGFDDLIVGGLIFGGYYWYSTSISSAYVIFGKESGIGSVNVSDLSAADGFTISGLFDSTFGTLKVASAGDVNGDGFDDLIVGSPNTNAAYVIYGKQGMGPIDLTNLAPEAGFAILGDNAGDLAGSSVAGIGDFNGDGIDDILIGAPNGNSAGLGSGEAYVIFGKTTGISAIDLGNMASGSGFAIRADDPFDRAGQSVAGIGDFNGDGLADIVIGVPDGNSAGFRSGEAYVIFGKTSGFGTIDLGNMAPGAGFAVQAGNPQDSAGWSVSGAGDVNGDGLDDVMIGAPYANSGGHRSGAAYVIFGKTTGFGTIDLGNPAAWAGLALYGDAGDQAGWSVSGAGDIDGDGYDDVAVGAPENDRAGWLAGATYIISGKLTFAKDVRNDFNGDGRSDVLWHKDNGDVTNWLGQPNGGFVGNFANASHHAGTDWNIAGTGDFNGDGRDDVLWRNDSGAVTNWLGQANGSFASNFANSYGEVDNSWDIAGTGDFNGDGRDDVLWRNHSGAVTNWLGQANGGFASNFANAHVAVDNSWHIAGTGDFNGDGRDDVLWRNDSGAVTNWLGQANGGFVGNFENAATHAATNWHIAGTGDFNGDGRDDVLWRSDNGDITNWLGQANGAFVGNFANASHHAGSEWNVASIGDYNGDGRDDVLWRSDSGAVTNWLGLPNGGFAGNFSNAYGVVDNSWQVQPPSEMLI
jgi:hypothetical protein